MLTDKVRGTRNNEEQVNNVTVGKSVLMRTKSNKHMFPMRFLKIHTQNQMPVIAGQSGRWIWR